MDVVKFTLLAGAKAPVYSSAGAAGLDLFARLNTPDAVLAVRPMMRVLVSTGVSMEIPSGYYGRIAPRSGLAVSKGLDIMAGVIDNDYRGEVKILVINLGQEAIVIHDGDKIAQMIFERSEQLVLTPKNALAPSARGAGGFGSTG